MTQGLLGLFRIGGLLGPEEDAGGGGGPPGAWRLVAKGSLVLGSNVNTVVHTFVITPGEVILALLTITDHTGLWSIYTANTFSTPPNGRTLYMLRTQNAAGTHELWARQFNAGGAPVSYDWAIYAVVP